MRFQRWVSVLQLQALRKKIVGVGVTESEFMEVCKRVCERLALRGLVRLASTPVRREGLCDLRRWRAEHLSRAFAPSRGTASHEVAGAGRGVGKLRDRRCRRKLAVADERIFGHGSRLVHSAAFIGPYLKRTDVGLRVAGAARRGFQRSR